MKKIFMSSLFIPLLAIANVNASRSTSEELSSNLKTFFESSQANKVCQKAIIPQGQRSKRNLRFISGNSDEVFFAFRRGRMSTILIVNISNGSERIIKLEGKIQDIVTHKGEIYYLTNTQLLIVNNNTGKLVTKIGTLPQNLKYFKNAYARGVYINDGLIYIAHGIHGIMVFDRNYNKFINPINPKVPQPIPAHISMVTDVEGLGSKLYFTYDDVTLSRNSKAFEGLAIWNIKQDKLKYLIPVKQVQEGYFLSHLFLDSEELIISNLDLNYRHNLEKLETDRYMRPLQRIYKYPYGALLGRAFILNKTIYGCFRDYRTGLIRSGSMSY